jgi:hypothetical protein
MLYPISTYTYNESLNGDSNLEYLLIYYKINLLKGLVFIKPQTIDEYNELMNYTSDVIELFKTDIKTFPTITDNETKWTWIGKIRNEESSILNRAFFIVNKLCHP